MLTIKTAFPAILTPSFTQGTVWKKLGDLWCRFVHDSWMWPIHGETQHRILRPAEAGVMGAQRCQTAYRNLSFRKSDLTKERNNVSYHHNSAGRFETAVYI